MAVDKRNWRMAVGLLLVLLAAVTLLSGCGLWSHFQNKRWAKEKAIEQMEEKYGIEAKVHSTKIISSEYGWVLVTMQEADKTFRVLVMGVDSGDPTEMSTVDDYEADDICDFYEDYVKASMKADGLRVPDHVRIAYSQVGGPDLNFFMVDKKFTHDVSFFGQAGGRPVAVLDYCGVYKAYDQKEIIEYPLLTDVFKDFMIFKWKDSQSYEQHAEDEELWRTLHTYGMDNLMPYLEGYYWNDAMDDGGVSFTLNEMNHNGALLITQYEQLDEKVKFQVIDKELEWRWSKSQKRTFEQMGPIYEVSVDPSVDQEGYTSYLYIPREDSLRTQIKEVTGGKVTCDQGNYRISGTGASDGLIQEAKEYYVIQLVLRGGDDTGYCILLE